MNWSTVQETVCFYYVALYLSFTEFEKYRFKGLMHRVSRTLCSCALLTLIKWMPNDWYMFATEAEAAKIIAKFYIAVIHPASVGWIKIFGTEIYLLISWHGWIDWYEKVSVVVLSNAKSGIMQCSEYSPGRLNRHCREIIPIIMDTFCRFYEFNRLNNGNSMRTS